MTIIYDLRTNSGYQASQSTYAFDHEFLDTTRFPGLVAAVAIFSGGTVSSILSGSRNLTFIRADVNGSMRLELWYLSSTVNHQGITVNLSQSTNSVTGAATFHYFAGAIGTHSGTTGTGTPASHSLTPTRINSIVVSAIAAATTTGVTDEASQFNIWFGEGAGGSMRGAFKGPVNPIASTSLQFENIGASDAWAMSSVELLDYVDSPPAIMGM